MRNTFSAISYREVGYYFRLSNIISSISATDRERVTATLREGTRRMRDLSDDQLHAVSHRDEDEAMPGEVLHRIMRYESHLERQFERKLQQLVAWRRAKGEQHTPTGSDKEAGSLWKHA